MALKRRSELAQTVPFNTWRDYPPMNTSVGTMLHNKTGSWRYIKPIYEDKVPACQNACPAGNDIEGWIKFLQRGDYEGAYRHLKREEPFPAILGRVCFKFCESACNRLTLDHSVSIKELERFVGDQVTPSKPHPDLPADHGKTMAVVGSGPAGMSAAYFGRLLGFKVALFEKLPEMGGILRVGIPGYRLPRNVVEAEFEGLHTMGVELFPGIAVGHDISLSELADTYDYVFLASGVHESMRLGLAGEDACPRVMSGLNMLRMVARGRDVDLGRRVVVIGGGNTAIDAARTAVRMGLDATILYRRSESEMPAHPEEIQEGREEGVHFRFLAAPERIDLNDDSTIRKLVCCEMELGPPDASGRKRPVKKPGALFDVETDSILTAIGELPVFDYLSDMVAVQDRVVAVDDALQARSEGHGKAKIFAGGDIVNIPHTVVHAVASGKRAAVAMDCDRIGRSFGDALKEITIGQGPAISFSAYMGWKPVNPVRQNLHVVVDSEKIVYDYFRKAPPVDKKTQPGHLRKTSFEAYTQSFKNREAQEEAARCMHCGRCTECDNCLILCPDISVLVKGGGRFGYAFDYDYCKGCGVCFTECPRHAITMIDEETPLEEEV